MEQTDPNVKQSYPLSALFVLVAACAVVCTLLTPIVRAIVSGNVGGKETAIASVGGSLLAMLVGAVVGLYHYRPYRGLAWGILCGGVIGMIAGPVVLAPPESLDSLMTMSIAGAIVLVITGAAFGLARRNEDDDDDVVA